MKFIGSILAIAFWIFLVLFVIALIKHKPAKKKGIIALVCLLVGSACIGTSENNSDKSNASSHSSHKLEKVSSKKFSSSSSSSNILSSFNSKLSSSSSSFVSSTSETSISTNEASIANTQQTQQAIQNQNSINTAQNNNYSQTGLDDTAKENEVIGDSKTHIYHTADQHNYKINPKNEVVFANEQQAINAGYRKSER